MTSPDTRPVDVVITGGTILTPRDEISPGTLTVAGGSIRDVRPGAPVCRGDETIDATGLYVAPGFIDLHTQGGCGHDIWMGTAEALQGWSRCQAVHGVTAFMLTTGYKTAGYDYLCGHIDEVSVAAKPLGVYLESPFCSMARRGGISEQRVGEVSIAKLDEVHATLGEHLVMMTVAPERENALEVIGELVRRGVIAAIGHTDCTYEQALAAVDAGATHVTHCFNTMRSLHHRDPGPLPLVLTDERVDIELVLDGIHIVPPVVRFAVGVRGVDRTCVVTDNMRAAGLPPGDYTFHRMEQTIYVKGGVPRLPDGTIAGSCLTMDRALANVLAFTGLPLNQALVMLTSTPARAARVDDRKGRLAPGFDADVVLFDRDFNVVRTLVGGKTVYRRDRLDAGPRVATSKCDAH